MNSTFSKKLIDLYNETSKHSNYQVLAPDIEKLLSSQAISVHSRQEKERWKYIASNICLTDMDVIDIGGNTGYFSFESLANGAFHVNYYEGNHAHCEFVRQAAFELNLQDKLFVHNNYIDLNDDKIDVNADIMLLLNVLHHVGDDYGPTQFTKNDALHSICSVLKALSYKVKTLVFQLGFNWKGDCNLPLFSHGTKEEMINFINSCSKGYWDIDKIGIPEKINSNIQYNDIDDLNIKRNDSLGEFLNRPIFIMKSIRR